MQHESDEPKDAAEQHDDVARPAFPERKNAAEPHYEDGYASQGRKPSWRDAQHYVMRPVQREQHDGKQGDYGERAVTHWVHFVVSLHFISLRFTSLGSTASHYFFAALGAAAAPEDDFNSMSTASNGVSPVFSGLWTPAGA